MSQILSISLRQTAINHWCDMYRPICNEYKQPVLEACLRQDKYVFSNNNNYEQIQQIV